MKKVITAVALAAIASIASAQSTGTFYGEAAYGMVTTKDTSDTNNLGSFDLAVGRFTLGSVVANNVAIEGFITQGLSGDSKVIRGVNLNVKAKMGYGLAIRPYFNATEQIELFGRIGTLRNEVEATASAGGRTLTDSSKTTNTLYGVGVAYKINKQLSATVDYTKFSKKDDADTSMYSFGLRYNF